MTTRQNTVTELQTYLKDVDTEVTMILQSLQWDRKHLVEKTTLVQCQYDSNHRVPPDKLVEHERECFLKSQGYSVEDRLLPSPVDPDANTLVKLSSANVAEIIKNASRGRTSFLRTGTGCGDHQPLTLERLQATYTADERLAIHDAVVNQVPSCHDLSDLALLGTNDDGDMTKAKAKTKMEILAELRDMKRRRTKYRVAAKTRNYSAVLHDVITTQMELYTQAKDNVVNISKEDHYISGETKDNHNRSKERNTPRYHDNSPNREYHRNEVGHCSSVDQVKNSASSHSKHSEEYDSGKRRHEDSYHSYKRYSKREERPLSKTRKTDRYKADMHFESKSIRREDRQTNSAKVNREVHKHYEDYEKQKRQRGKDSDRRKPQSATHAHAESTFHAHEKSGIVLTIKKEEDESYNDISDNDIEEYIGQSSQSHESHYLKANKDMKKQYVDNRNSKSSCETYNNSQAIPKEIHIKKERKSSSDSDEDSSESADTYDEYRKSKNTYRRSSHSTTFKHYDNNHDRKYDNGNRPKYHSKALHNDDIKLESDFDIHPLQLSGGRRDGTENTETYYYNDKHHGHGKIEKGAKYTEHEDRKKRRRKGRDIIKEKYKNKSSRKE